MTSEKAFRLQQFYIHMKAWRDSERLRRRWRDINEHYFGGKLEPVRIGYNPAMLWNPGLRIAAGWTLQKGRYGSRKYWVCLHPFMKKHSGTVRELNTLIHEGIHVLLHSRDKGHVGHGGDFRHVFERLLYRQGAFSPDYAAKQYVRYGWKKPAKFSVFTEKWHRTYSSPPTTT